MITGVYFDGDSKELQDIQHECYHHALGIIVNNVIEITQFAIALLGDKSSSKWEPINKFDHRTLQMAHDVIASEWRFKSGVIQTPLFFSLPYDSQSLTLEWLKWLKDEVHSWAAFDSLDGDSRLIYCTQKILHNQNTKIGYMAESELTWRLMQRYNKVPWDKSMKELFNKLITEGNCDE